MSYFYRLFTKNGKAMRRFLLGFTLLVILTGPVLGQGIPKDSVQQKTKDSARDKEKGKPATGRRRYEHRRFDSTLFMENAAATQSDYLESVEKVFLLLDQVPVELGSFGQLANTQVHLQQENAALGLLKDRLSQSEKTFNIRNLQMFNVLLDELHKNENDYAKYLDACDNKIDTVKKQIGGLRKDTLMLHIFRDTALKASFDAQLSELRDKWRQADSLIKTNSTVVNDLQALSSQNIITIEELSNKVDAELKAVGNKAFGKERRYLWEPGAAATGAAIANNGFKQSVDSEQKLVRYYFSNTRNKRFWLLLTGLAFFYWVFLNYRSLRRLNAMTVLDEFRFAFLRPQPYSATLIFILSLAPLFDIHAPAIYIESTQFLLMIVLSFIFYRLLSHDLFRGWCLFLLLFLLLPATRLLGLPIHLERWANLVQDSLSAALGIIGLLIRKRWIPGPDNRFVGARANFILGAVGLYIFLNLMAVGCNLAGRVTLSQIFGDTAVYALAQIISLTVFVHVVVECFLLQIQSSRVRKKYPQHFEFAGISHSIYRGASVLAALLWLIVFTTNLNLFDTLNDMLTGLFNSPRQVGSFSFTLGGIALFAGIIWVANFLQRYITYFFGDTGDDAAMDDKGQRSRLLIMRLIMLTLGFLLAVAASGLSIDRLTVILGALSVGIGLGLQSIVNNFISGVILIFDRPLRIGDTVEIGDKKGKVREIGIRSSRLLTEEGAEVIIPNGDVLSHNIVNWTLSNNFARVSLQFTVGKPGHPDDLRADAIRDLVKANANVLERRDPEVLISPISSKQLSLKIYFWCKEFNQVPFTTGEVQSAIYEYFEAKGIAVE
jgi:potassium efflux system protein